MVTADIIVVHYIIIEVDIDMTYISIVYICIYVYVYMTKYVHIVHLNTCGNGSAVWLNFGKSYRPKII